MTSIETFILDKKLDEAAARFPDGRRSYPEETQNVALTFAELVLISQAIELRNVIRQAVK
jgi:hypothetical protein